MSNKITIYVEDLKRQGDTLFSLADQIEKEKESFGQNVEKMRSATSGFSEPVTVTVKTQATLSLCVDEVRFGAQVAKDCADAFEKADRENAKYAGNINAQIIKNGGDSYKDQANSNSSQQIQSQAMKELQDKYDDIKYRRDDQAYEGMCASLVTDQLERDGLYKYPRGGKYSPADGYAYAKTLINQGKTNTGAKVDGYNSFDDLLQKNQEPITNVVISYLYGGWVNDGTHGHVMLISRIENGKVYFMDNRKPPLYSVRDKNDRHLIMKALSIEDFKKEYFENGMRPNGIAHITK